MASNYVSVIKINHKPILPPLITPEKRKELRRLKKQAIKIEKRICRAKVIQLKSDDNNPSNKNIPAFGSELSDYKKECLKNLTCDIQAESYIDNEFVEINSSIDEWNPINSQLIRSNSYILENPSPALLEYIRTHNLTDETRILFPHNYIEDDVSTIKDNFCINQCQDLDTSCTETELINLSDDSRPITALTEDDNKIKQFIDNNVPFINENDKSIEQLEVPNDISEVLDKIPKEYSRRILEFLENEKLESEKRIDTYIKLHSDTNLYSQTLARDFDNLNDSKKFSTPTDNKNLLNNTNYYSVMSEDRNTDLSSADLNLDLSYKHIDDLDEVPCILEEQSKELLCLDHKTQKFEQIERAASVIQAGIRGYLTRRLLRTEKVEGLKNVIKEALLCAIQLHSENIETISESDVELHRRLMKQVITGCYAFNEVFFDTTSKEQMLIISMDRQMKREKLKKGTKSPSNRSTPNRVTLVSQSSSITV